MNTFQIETPKSIIGTIFHTHERGMTMTSANSFVVITWCAKEIINDDSGRKCIQFECISNDASYLTTDVGSKLTLSVEYVINQIGQPYNQGDILPAGNYEREHIYNLLTSILL